MDEVTKKQLESNIGKIAVFGLGTDSLIIGVCETFPTWGNGKPSLNYVVELETPRWDSLHSYYITTLLVHVSNVTEIKEKES